MKKPVLLSGLLGLTLSAQAQLQVQQFDPARNTNTAPRSASVRLTYNQPLDASTAANVRVFSRQAGGRKAGTATVTGSTITFDPTTDFKPGETVSVTAPATVLSNNAMVSKPAVYQFTTQVRPSTGTFVTGPISDAGDSPTSMAPADVDGDGDLDVLVANFNPNWVSVRLNDGSGRFTFSETASSIGSSPRSLRSTDLDADGDLDFITISGGFTAYGGIGLNDGTGRFPGRSSANLGYSNNSDRIVTTADVDADGDQDAIMGANRGLYVFLNNGAGRFPDVPPKTSLNDFGARDIVPADIDSDGDLDLLITTDNSATNEVRVLLNNGAGSFGNGYGVSVPASPNKLVVADADGDGDLDLFTTSFSSTPAPGTVLLLRNNGTGSFGAPTSVATTSDSPSSLAAADIDGDGDLDLLTAVDGATGSVSVLRNNGTGSFSASGSLAPGNRTNSVVPADVDGDGDLDLLVLGRLNNTIQVFYNTNSVLATTSAAAAEPVRVYPNPAQDAFTVEYTAAAAQSATLTLTDPLGRLVQRQPLQLRAGRNRFPLSAATLTQGFYHLILTTGSGPAVSQKVLVNH